MLSLLDAFERTDSSPARYGEDAFTFLNRAAAPFWGTVREEIDEQPFYVEATTVFSGIVEEGRPPLILAPGVACRVRERKDDAPDPRGHRPRRGSYVRGEEWGYPPGAMGRGRAGVDPAVPTAAELVKPRFKLPPFLAT
jgi:hypothetical protein